MSHCQRRNTSLSRHLAIAGILLILAAAPAAMAQNLLSDPGFEEVDVQFCNFGNLFETNEPWYRLGFPSESGSPDVLSLDCSTLAGADPTQIGLYDITFAHGGLRFMGAGALGNITETFGQTLSVPLTEGENYLLSGYFTQADPSFAPEGYYEVWMAGTVGVDDVKVGEIGLGAPIGSWGELSIQFEAPAGASIIYFVGTIVPGGAPVCYVGCDDLVLAFDDTIAVEPSSWGSVKSLYR